METGRIHGSDIWHEVRVGLNFIRFECLGRSVLRKRVLLDRDGVNLTCLKCLKRNGKEN